jgi:hypothetical protein
MRINVPPSPPRAPGPLLELVRQAHAEALEQKAQGLKKPPRHLPLRDPLTVALFGIARGIVGEHFTQASEVRARLIELMLEEQDLPVAEADEDEPSYEEVMRLALIDDPMFALSLEDSLIKAAVDMAWEQEVV